MAKFVDSNGDEWVITLSTRNIIKVCRKLDIKLSTLLNGDLNVADVFEAVSIFCESQYKKKGMTEDDFFDALGMASYKDLITALMADVQEAFGTGEEGGDSEGEA